MCSKTSRCTRLSGQKLPLAVMSRAFCQMHPSRIKRYQVQTKRIEASCRQWVSDAKWCITRIFVMQGSL